MKEMFRRGYEDALACIKWKNRRKLIRELMRIRKELKNIEDPEIVEYLKGWEKALEEVIGDAS